MVGKRRHKKRGGQGSGAGRLASDEIGLAPVKLQRSHRRLFALPVPLLC